MPKKAEKAKSSQRHAVGLLMVRGRVSSRKKVPKKKVRDKHAPNGGRKEKTPLTKGNHIRAFKRGEKRKKRLKPKKKKHKR